MIRKSAKTIRPTRKKPTPRRSTPKGPLPWAQLVKLYPALANGPTPEERRAKLFAGKP